MNIRFNLDFIFNFIIW